MSVSCGRVLLSSLLSAIILSLVDGNGSVSSSQQLPFDSNSAGCTYLPLGSVWLDHLGVHLMTVEAQYAGNCSSNILRNHHLRESVSFA